LITASPMTMPITAAHRAEPHARPATAGAGGLS